MPRGASLGFAIGAEANFAYGQSPAPVGINRRGLFLFRNGSLHAVTLPTRCSFLVDMRDSWCIPAIKNAREIARHRAKSTTKSHQCDYVDAMTRSGRPREFEENRVTKALRISPEMDTRLKNVAHERGVSVNVLVNIALEDFLDRLLPIDQVFKTAS
jgi:hypothetical protein